jgi:putative salt-induced outer membrane protein YdiY
MLRNLSIAAALALWSATALADTVKLANGDELSGEIVEWAVDHLVIDHPQLGRVTLALDQLELDTGEPPNPGLFGTRFLRGWTRGIDLGLSGKQGNTSSTNITAGIDFDYSDDWRRWRLRGRYFYNSSDDGDNDNNARVDLRRDWLVPGSRWFGFATGRYQYDQFESWQHRVVLAGGPGLHLVEGENHSLDALLGPSVTREFGTRDENRAEILFGLDYSWKITERHTFTLGNSLFTQYKPDAGEFRNVTIGELRILLTERPSLNLRIGAENEYDSVVEDDDEHNNLQYYLSLGLDF